MFAKLSALAMCFSIVSAFNIVVPATVHAGTAVTLQLNNITTSDPPYVSLVIAEAQYQTINSLSSNALLDSKTTVYIPARLNRGEYLVIANPIHDQHTVLARSNTFKLVSSYA